MNEDYTNRGKSVFRVIQRIAGKDGSMNFVDPYNVLCDSGDCLIHSGGRTLYNDSSHLSVSGSELMSGSLSGFFGK